MAINSNHLMTAGSIDDAVRARRVFWLSLWATLALKLVLAVSFPMTGDEAFFYQWGVYPAWGYSDHPPMVGWLLAVLRHLGDAPGVLRLVTVAVTTLLGWGVVDMARRLLPAEREAVAWWAGAVYLALPWSWLFVLVTTDTPLVLFVGLSAWCYLRADLSGSGRRAAGWYALAGLFVGLGFLSKYFAALLGLAYAVHVLGWRRSRWWALAWMFLLAVPFIGVNLYFNATHGWPNMMFNFFNRHEGSHWSAATLLVYVGMMAYLLTPWLIWQAWRSKGVLAGTAKTAGVLWAFPFLLFLLLSTRRSVGLHWVLGFVPLFVLWAAVRLDVPALRRAWRWTLGLGVPHLVLVAAIVWAPLGWWQHSKLYEKLVFLREARALTHSLEHGLPQGAALMAYAYSPAAVLAYYHGEYVPVFGPGRHHSRQDDQLIDFRAWEGKTVRILARDGDTLDEYAPFFDQVSWHTVDVAGITYRAVDGVGFRYQPYRDQVLVQAHEQFYRIPRALPIWGSPFCERYGFADCAPGRGR